MRTAVQRRFGLAPVRRPVPRRRLELMLNVEQPDAGGRGDDDDRQMDDEERHEAHAPDEQAGRNQDARVGAHRAEPRHGALAHEAERQPALDQEHVGRADPEHHQGMAIEPIKEPAARVQREIFPHRLRLDVADAAPVEIARRRMVDRVAAPPESRRASRSRRRSPGRPSRWRACSAGTIRVRNRAGS